MTARKIKANAAKARGAAGASSSAADAGVKAKAARSGFGRPGMIRPIRQRRIWLGGPLMQELLRELEAGLRPAELDQILKEELRRMPWQKRPGCAGLMLLVLVLLGGATTLAGLDAGRQVLERLAERHRHGAGAAAMVAEAEAKTEAREGTERGDEGSQLDAWPGVKEVGPLRGPEE